MIDNIQHTALLFVVIAAILVGGKIYAQWPAAGQKVFNIISNYSLLTAAITTLIKIWSA